jgi:hypothetical protein
MEVNFTKNRVFRLTEWARFWDLGIQNLALNHRVELTDFKRVGTIVFNWEPITLRVQKWELGVDKGMLRL